MKPTAPCAVTLPAHQPHASHRRPRRKMCRHPVECHLESRHAAYATSRLSAHPAPTCGAMRESSRTTLVPRLPAPCRVATQGLPASARLCGSARCQPGCSLRSPATARHRCRAAPTARFARGCPSGQRAKRPPSRRVRVLRSVRVCARPLASVALRAVSPPCASGVEWLAILAERIKQGRSPARPRASQPREEHAARFACPTQTLPTRESSPRARRGILRRAPRRAGCVSGGRSFLVVVLIQRNVSAYVFIHFITAQRESYKNLLMDVCDSLLQRSLARGD